MRCGYLISSMGKFVQREFAFSIGLGNGWLSLLKY